MFWKKVWCSHSACCTRTLANHFSMLLTFHSSPCMVHWLHTCRIYSSPWSPFTASLCCTIHTINFVSNPAQFLGHDLYLSNSTYSDPWLGYYRCPFKFHWCTYACLIQSSILQSSKHCCTIQYYSWQPILGIQQPTAGLLMCWQYSQSTAKSKDELNCLWKYIKDPTFNPQEQLDFSHDCEWKQVGKYLEDDTNPFRAQHSWFCSSFDLLLIKENIQYTSEDDPSIPTITIKNFYHRLIVDIMKSVFSEKVLLTFHMTPFKEFWITADGCNIRVYSETYTSPHILDTYREINSNPWEDGDNYKQIIAPLMLWSDAT